LASMTGFAKNNIAIPEVSVLIPHYNDKLGLRLCLDSLRVQNFPTDKFEVIVADNDTPTGVADIAALYPEVRFVCVKERGAAPARNAAMAAAAGACFAFIDSDCVASPDWIKAGVKGLESADYSGGVIEITFADSDRPTPVEAFEMVFGFRQQMYLKRKRFSATANLFVRREAAEAIGSFKNAVAEDLDWGRRADALGFRLAFNAISIVSHPARHDWQELVRKWDRLVQERWNGFESRRLVDRLKWIFLAIATALSAAPHLWMVATSEKLSRIQDKIAAAGVLGRIRLWRAWRMLTLLAAKG